MDEREDEEWLTTMSLSFNENFLLYIYIIGPSSARLPDGSGSDNANKSEVCQSGDALEKLVDSSLLRHLPFLSYVFPTDTVNHSTVANDVSYYSHKKKVKIAKMMEKSEKLRKREQRGLTCDICSTKFKRIEHLRAHKGERKNKLHCTVCDTWFTCLKNFGKHKRTHSNLKCDKCDKTFNTLAGYKLHGAQHWDVKPHQCDTCGKSFAYQGHLKTHQILHSVDYQFQCETCDKRFKSMGSMMKHKHSAFAHQSSFTCGDCGKVFKSTTALKRHHSVHHNKNAKRFPCDTCDMSFSQKASLTRHQKVSCVESTE